MLRSWLMSAVLVGAFTTCAATPAAAAPRFDPSRELRNAISHTLHSPAIRSVRTGDGATIVEEYIAPDKWRAVLPGFRGAVLPGGSLPPGVPDRATTEIQVGHQAYIQDVNAMPTADQRFVTCRMPRVVTLEALTYLQIAERAVAVQQDPTSHDMLRFRLPHNLGSTSSTATLRDAPASAVVIGGRIQRLQLPYGKPGAFTWSLTYAGVIPIVAPPKTQIEATRPGCDTSARGTSSDG
jgi:hypothetical protein